MLDQIFAYIIGTLVGIFSGLIPGIHSNTTAQILANILPLEFLGITIMLSVGIYSVLSFFPALFFGIPDDATGISALPGHKLVKKGKGIHTLRTVMLSIGLSIIISLMLLPIAFQYYGPIYSIIEPYLPYILIIALAYLLFSEKRINKILKTALIIGCAGLLGLLTLNMPIQQPLLPLFVGFFAIPALLQTKQLTFTKTRNKPIKIPWRIIIIGVLAGFAADLLPGISTGTQMAIFLAPLFYLSSLKFLVFTSSLSISHIIFAIPAITSTGKSRIGAFTFLKDIPQNQLFYIGLLIIGMFIGILIIYAMIKKLDIELNMEKVSKYIIIYLISIVLLLSGITGLATLLSATILGLLTIKLNVRRVHLMSSLVIPTIILLI